MKTRAILALLVALPISAMAVPVKYEFSGTLNQRGSTVPEWYDFEFSFTEAFSGSFTLETEASSYYADPSMAFYGDAISQLQVSFGPDGSLGTFAQSSRPIFEGYPYTSNLYFLNDYGSAEGGGFVSDQMALAVNLNSAPGDSPYLSRSLSLSVWDPTATLFPAIPTLDQFPVSPFASENYWSLSIGVLLNDANGGYVGQASYGGSLTSLRRVDTSVPEPATWTLLVAGLVGVGFARRRRLA